MDHIVCIMWVLWCTYALRCGYIARYTYCWICCYYVVGDYNHVRSQRKHRRSCPIWIIWACLSLHAALAFSSSHKMKLKLRHRYYAASSLHLILITPMLTLKRCIREPLFGSHQPAHFEAFENLHFFCAGDFCTAPFWAKWSVSSTGVWPSLAHTFKAWMVYMRCIQLLTTCTNLCSTHFCVHVEFLGTQYRTKRHKWWQLAIVYTSTDKNS